MPDSNQVQTLTTTEFAFDDTVFTVDCTDPNEPRFSLPQVCTFLGYSNVSHAVARHTEPEDVSYAVIPTSSGDQRVRMVNEPGLYSLIFASKMAKAKEFRRRVFREILPSIRKTGEYKTKARRLVLAKGQLADFITLVQKDLLKVTSRDQMAIMRAQIKDFEVATGITQQYLSEWVDLREQSLDIMERDDAKQKAAVRFLNSKD